MNFIKSNLVGLLALVLIAGMSLFGGGDPIGGTTNFDDLELSSLTTTGAVTLGGDLTVTTTNAATSSVEVGCIDTYATSTDTAIRISATTTGPVLAVFGSCSGL